MTNRLGCSPSQISSTGKNKIPPSSRRFLSTLSLKTLTEHPGHWLHFVPTIKSVNCVCKEAKLRNASHKSHAQQHACPSVRFPLKTCVMSPGSLKVRFTLLQGQLKLFSPFAGWNFLLVILQCCLRLFFELSLSEVLAILKSLSQMAVEICKYNLTASWDGWI